MLPESVLEKTLASFLPARQILKIRRLSKSINHSVGDKDGIFQQTACDRWEERQFPQNLIRPASKFISSHETMGWCRSIFFGFIEDDGSYGGRGVRPSSCGGQPHDYVMREAVAEWLTDAWAKMHRPYNASEKSTAVKCDRSVDDWERDFVHDDCTWIQAVPVMMCSNEILDMHPFMILNKTRHEDDDATVRGAYLRDNIIDYDLDENDLVHFIQGWTSGDDVLDENDVNDVENEDSAKTGCRESSDDDSNWPELPMESNGTLQLASLMIRSRDGIMRLPVWEGQSVDRWNASDQGGNYTRFHKMATRHCAQWYFPKWLFEDFDRMSAAQSTLNRHRQPNMTERPENSMWFDRRFASFVQSSCFESEEVSSYMLTVDVGVYTAGFLWLKETES